MPPLQMTRALNAWANEHDVARDHLVAADQREGLVPSGKHAWHGVAECGPILLTSTENTDVANMEPPVFRTFVQRESSL